jgi:hypothetical protein
MICRPGKVHIWDEKTGGSLCGEAGTALIHQRSIESEPTLIRFVCEKCMEKARREEADENR